MERHTCILDDGGTPNRKCMACETEKACQHRQWVRRRDGRECLDCGKREFGE